MHQTRFGGKHFCKNPMALPFLTRAPGPGNTDYLISVMEQCMDDRADSTQSRKHHGA